MPKIPGQPTNERSRPDASPLVIKTYDMVLWLLAHTQKFPKSQRFVLAKRMEEAALSFQDQILWATKTSRKQPALLEADYHLERLRMYNRMALGLKIQAPNQFQHLSRALDELGRLLGGWIRKLRAAAAARDARA